MAVFYNSSSIENRYFVKACSNYARIILKLHENYKLASLAKCNTTRFSGISMLAFIFKLAQSFS